MDKIKINLDGLTLNKLNDDMLIFGFYKNNGTINKNKFLNILMKNYFPIYDKLATSYIDKYTKIMNSHVIDSKLCNEIINSLIASNKLFSYNKEEKLSSSINFKPANSNIHILNIISSKYLNFQSLSSFFRNLIERYLSLPQYKREQIIYSDTYELINEAISNKRKIIVCFNGKKKEIIPYKLVNNKEEIYNYLIGLASNDKSGAILSLHLYKIDYVYIKPEKFIIDDLDQEKLEKVIYHSPQFPFYFEEKCSIRLTPDGIKLYNKKYLNRPTPYKIENDTYYFDCSFMQILIYFFSFGKDAKILEPEQLRNKFKDKYLEALTNYE